MGLIVAEMEMNEYQVILDLLNETNSYSREFPKSTSQIDLEDIKKRLLDSSSDSSFVPRTQIQKANLNFDEEAGYFLQLTKLYFTALNRTERINRSVPREQLNYTFAI